MRQQDSESNCGVFAVKNALAAIGIERNSKELEKPLRTTATNGTELKHIFGYLKTLKECEPMRISEKRRDVALLKLKHSLLDGRPVVIAWTTEKPGDHWVAAVGILGKRFLIADAADLELVISVEVDEVAEKWCCGGYEGVVL